MEVRHTTLITVGDGAHSSVKASTTYSAKLKHTMASCDGLMMIVQTQLNV